MNEILSVPQLAAETGESAAVWRKRLLRREIPHLKLGRNVRILRQDLTNYLCSRVVPAKIENPILAPQAHLRQPK